MRFLRPQPGLILWACIALLVLCVPLWRVRAVRQWHSSLIEPLLPPGARPSDASNSRAGFGLSQNQAQEMAERLPSDIDAGLAQFDESKLVAKYNALQKPFYAQNYSTQSYSNEADRAKAQKNLHQFTPQVRKLTDEYFARYDSLERRFPNSNKVRAQHLREAMGGSIISDEGPLPPLPAGKSYPFLMIKQDSWLSPAMRDAALRSAREAARREPDNAFFPWMEAILCFSSGQNDGALRALEAAAKCSDFRDYGLPTVAGRLDTLKRLRATGWEDDYTELVFSVFPHLARMRSAARAASGQMRLARRRGDRVRAFRFAAATTRAGTVVARSGASTLISCLVGKAICSIAWRAAIEDEPDAPEFPSPPSSISNEQRTKLYTDYWQQNALYFAAMARANGQNDLAREVVATNSNFDGKQLSDWIVSSPNSPVIRLGRLAADYWMNSQLLHLSLEGALVWGLLWGLTRQRGEAFGRARSQMLIPTMFFVGVTGTLLFVARTIIPVAYQFSEWLTAYSRGTDIVYDMPPVFEQGAPIIGAGWLMIVIIATLISIKRAQESPPVSPQPKWRLIVRGAAWVLFIVCALVLLENTTGHIHFSAANDWVLYCSSVVVGLDVIVGSALFIWRTSGARRVVALCAMGAFWIGVADWILLFLSGDGPFYGAIAIWFAGLLALVALALGLRIRSNRETLLHFALQATLRARMVAGTLAIFSAIGYLGMALWIIPAEQNVRALLHRQFQIGEVAFLREQIQKESGRH